MNVKRLDEGHFESGFWKVDGKHTTTVKRIYLHQSRSERSYLQGEVIGIRPVLYQGSQRFVFVIMEDSRSGDWEGNGTGEKGYGYA